MACFLKWETTLVSPTHSDQFEDEGPIDNSDWETVSACSDAESETDDVEPTPRTRPGLWR
jgi:hypothetical protein